MACFDRHPVVAYHYSPSRSQDIPLGLLSDKTQALMIDGYNGYQPACERYLKAKLARPIKRLRLSKRCIESKLK